MAEHVVIDHHHDPDAGVYRLCAGIPITETRPVLTDDGELTTETVTVGYDDLIDVVFADDDKRWAALSPADLAAQQRAIVDEAVTARDQAAAPAPVVDLPGVGDALGT